MPPYSSSSNIFDDHTGSNPYSDPFVDIPLGSSIKQQQQGHSEEGEDADPWNPSTTASQEETAAVVEGEEDADRSPSVLEKILDFNPCMSMGKPSFTMPNPASAVFKSRSCSECGRKCTKLQGYKKEGIEKTILVVVDEETGEEKEVKETTKIYYHKWCSQIKEYREEHKQKDNGGGYESVMRNLLDHFRALELEAQMKRDAEIRRKAQEEEEALRIAVVEEEQAAAKADAEAGLESKARSAPFEVSLVGKKPSFMKRVTKAFSITKGCTSIDAVDKSANNKEVCEEAPSPARRSSSRS